MSAWVVLIPAERVEDERLYHHDLLEVGGADPVDRPASGDPVLVLANGPADGDKPQIVALGRVRPARPDAESTDPATTVVVRYTMRAFDTPVPADLPVPRAALTRIDPAVYRSLAGRLSPAADPSTWLVSLSLPIEAPSRAEAVRVFWSYVRELGPAELPAYVWPSGDENAMRAFVLGAEANQDPEEDD